MWLFLGGTIAFVVTWVTAIVKGLKIKVEIPATTQILATSAASGLLLGFNVWRSAFNIPGLVVVDLVIGASAAAVGYSVLAQGQSTPAVAAG